MLSVSCNHILIKLRRKSKYLKCGFITMIIIIIIIHSQSTRLTKYIEPLKEIVNSDSNLSKESFSNVKNNSLEPSTNGRSDLAKYIHLDLKGAPPIANKFYESFFNFLEKLQMGVKGVVIEYEDTLPLQGNLENIGHQAGYTTTDIKLIQEAAKKHQIEVIPLIQTFGHLEWLLKLDRFKSYRDEPDIPTVISPCLNSTYILLEDLLQQTLNMHPDSKIIHIGCDEVMLKNFHDQCKSISMSISERYIDHIRRIADIVHKIRPDMRVLIWDDILRKDEFINNKKLLSQLKDIIEPVSWQYVPKFDEHYKSLSAWNVYPEIFKNTWAASAFKGGLSRFSMVTNTTHHVLNNREWLHFIESSTSRKKSISAIILTGWSRFDHFMPLCDILPTAYPSLIYSLHMLNTNKYLVDDSISNCDSLMSSIDKDSGLCESLPGISIWSNILSLVKLFSKIQNQLETLNTISPEYNRKRSFVRRYGLDFHISQLKVLENNLLSIKQKLDKCLTDLYSKDVIDEWFHLYLIPVEKQINLTFTEILPALNKTSWMQRPLD